MAGIKAPILDIMTRLTTLAALRTVRIWNNQVEYENTGKLYDFAKPAVFLEVINNVQYNQLGEGYQSADVGWRMHLVHEFFDAQDGTFEQDLMVFDIRDSIVTLMSFYEPTGCGPLTRTSETQDYAHDMIYHYIIDFVCNFTDSKGSKYDQGKYIDKTPPTDLEIDVFAPNTLNQIDYTVVQPQRSYSKTYTATSDGETSVYLMGGAGASIVMLIIEIKPINPAYYTYDPTTQFINLDSSVSMNAGQTLFIIFSKPLLS
jgi:hypothetical protein